MTNIDISRIRAEIQAVRAGNKFVLFKDLFPETPSWEHFIKHLDDAIHTFPASPPQEPLKQRVINGVIQRRLFYLMVDGPTEQYFPHSGIVHKTFNEALGGQISPVSAFINFVGKETPGGAHTDNRETIYWQCIGKSTWQIYDSYESKDPSFQIDLNPGDVIFVGESVVHRVVTEEPRAALGFQFRQNMI